MVRLVVVVVEVDDGFYVLDCVGEFGCVVDGVVVEDEECVDVVRVHRGHEVV